MSSSGTTTQQKAYTNIDSSINKTKAKLVALSDPFDYKANKEDNYSPHKVVAKMLVRKERKIPGSVFKPHSEQINLLQSVSLGQPQPLARVFFPYPAYCFMDLGSPNKTSNALTCNGSKVVNNNSTNKESTSSAMI